MPVIGKSHVVSIPLEPDLRQTQARVRAVVKRRKKMPTKAELLLQLQKLYKTDEKIGERLGGVPAYLIAYWRRKKNIPKYSLPKFSEQENPESVGAVR